MVCTAKFALGVLACLAYSMLAWSKPTGLESGAIIPLYIYPSDGNSWHQLFEAHSSYPINTWVIVNVNDGPGSSLDPKYQASIQSLHSARIKTLGYVLTNYGQRDIDEVKAEIDKWRNLYSPMGIFFDEMAFDDDDWNIWYYRELNDYAKSKGYIFTVGNPGRTTNPKYFNTVDNIVIYGQSGGFPSQDRICSQDTLGKGRGAVSILPYNIPSLNTVATEQMKSCAGYIYVTDDGGHNPWDTLPEYLPQLFQILST